MSIQNIWVGCYTQGKSEGLYNISFENGKFGTPQLSAKLQNPSFLAKHPTLPLLYALEEIDDFEGGGTVTVFTQSNNTISKIYQTETYGEHPCHMSLTDDSLFVANYSSGSISAFVLNEEGCPTAIFDHIIHKGNGPNVERQGEPHTHFISPYNNYIYVTDLGNDTLSQYSWKDAKLTLESVYNAPAGYGPRHLAFTDDKIILTYELQNKFAVLKNENSTWELLQEGETLDSVPETNYPSHIVVSSDGKTMYIANRGHDSISVFHKEGESWVLVQNHSCGAHFPRHFALSPCEGFLVVANQLGNAVVSLALDEDGLILEQVDSLEFHSPTCVLFG